MTSPSNPSDPAGSPSSVRPAADGVSSPDAPAIPSFESLRAPLRRTALDVLMPEAPAARPTPGPAPVPRPAQYDDLWRLGVRTARVVAGIPWRLANWSVRAPGALLDRLLGR